MAIFEEQIVKQHKFTDLESFAKAIDSTETLELRYQIEVEIKRESRYVLVGQGYEDVRYFVLTILKDEDD